MKENESCVPFLKFIYYLSALCNFLNSNISLYDPTNSVTVVFLFIAKISDDVILREIIAQVRQGGD